MFKSLVISFSRFAIGDGCLVREDDVSEDLKFCSDAAMIGVSMGIDMGGSVAGGGSFDCGFGACGVSSVGGGGGTDDWISGANGGRVDAVDDAIPVFVFDFLVEFGGGYIVVYFEFICGLRGGGGGVFVFVFG